MTINLKTTSLIATVLLTSLSGIVFASTNGHANAPEIEATPIPLMYSEIPYLDKAFIDATPANRKDGIPVGTLGLNGGNKKMILQFAQEIADHKHGSYDSFLIAHKGKLLFESYYNRGRVNLPHYQASATKSHTGLVLGRAIQLGYLTMEDLDKPLLSFLKDLDSTKFADGVENITLNQALTMQSGVRLSREQKKALKKKPARLKGQGLVQAWFENTTPITAESQRFKYGFGPEFVMQVIEAVVPGSAKDFIQKEFLEKMGITHYRWLNNGITGLPESGWRSSLTSRDMLKIGTLVMNNGQWNGEQLIPAAFIDKASSRLLYTGDDDVHYGGQDVSNQGYGYFWWSADLKLGHQSYYSVSAQGGNGQLITLIEELDLIIVHTANDNDTAYLQKIAENILPAFVQPSINP
ncbi:serine hydrolase domain-containing protein [Pseudoteredinibacter isoporae]|uniref:serine hydrolase domain-containing protein n=1 Tax=Pseudoteredinibacter isoporae TaxID=570281 RepID=UPI003101CDAC